MCGIAGFVGQGSREDLERMTRTLIHRGPDDEGYFFKAGEIGFGFRRLAIIDLETGNQPIFNEDKTVAVMLNGEIYNFRELRKELGPRHVFRTSGDTEVIAHLYEEVGERVFEKLNGMFAVALWDSKEQKLVLARDRLGKKPLYWAVFAGTLIFGSELKALMAHPLFRKELDFAALNRYLAYEYIPTPHSIFKNVAKLEPGTALIWQRGQVREERFWRLDFTERVFVFEEAMSELDRRLEESVRARLVSDVPLGIFLSGGLDSSTIAYYASRLSSSPPKTFTIGFRERSYDESAYAEEVARFLGTEHRTEILSSRDVLDVIPGIADLADEPLADPSIIPTYLLSRFTRRHVTVALGGDGGDELFAGYPTFQAERLAPFYRAIPRFIRHEVLEPLLRLLPVGEAYFSFDFKLKRFVSGFSGPDQYRHLRWLGSFGGVEERASLFRPEIWAGIRSENVYADADQYLAEAATASPVDRLLYLYLRTYLMDGVLAKADRASMHSALEVRAPFLDHRVVEFMSSLPFRFKCRGFHTKVLLKALMKDRLPHASVFRRKKGFALPLAGWLRRELRGLVEETLSERETKRIDVFDHSLIERIKQEHFTGRKDNRKPLWTLMVFYLWYRRWMR